MAKKFNAVDAYDESTEIFQKQEKPKASETMRAMVEAQKYMQKIHDDAYTEGFNAGLEANKKVDDL